MKRWFGLLVLAALLMGLTAAVTLAQPLRTYQVQDGDSLWTIAVQFFRDGTKWTEIAEANGIDVKNPRGLRVGETLIIPLGAAPLPATTRGPAIPQDKGYLVEEISDGLYWVTEGVYQVVFLTTGEGVIVVDAPPSIGQNILNAIAEVTDEPITHVVYSHSHADHIGAASIYPDDATYIAHEEALNTLTRTDANDPNRTFPFGLFVGGSPVPLPTVTFSDSFTLEVGNQTLELEYRGPNHEPGNIFVYAPRQKVLMLVDIAFPGWVPFRDLALAESIPGYVQAYDEALSFDFDTYIGGHLTRLGTREDVEIGREYIQDVRANAARALQTVDFFAVAQRTGFANLWLLLDTYLNTLAQTCTDLTLPNWIDRLGGADVWTFSHCLVMAESLRVE
ncbi:MAG: MBL fold metallo-hydrolase [Candidatus Bipolaricaulia bacterium]